MSQRDFVSASVKVTGYEDALQSLRRVDNIGERQKIMRGAIGATGRLVKQALLADPEFPTGTEPRHVPGYGVLPAGSLRKSVRISTRVEKGHALAQLTGAFAVRGAVIAGNRKKGIFWAHFIEGGVRPHSTSKGGVKGRSGRSDRGPTDRMHPGLAARWNMKNAGKFTENARADVFADYVEKRLAKLQQTGSA